ncbi:transposase [Bradyrhizobium sp. Arg314]
MRTRGYHRGDWRHPSSANHKSWLSYFGLNPRVPQSGLGLAQYGRISRHGRSRARAMVVEAAWAAAKVPGPLRGFFRRIRNKRGHQVAAVAVARKLAVLIWYLGSPGAVGGKAEAARSQGWRPGRARCRSSRFGLRL